ncbi:MAG: Smr/MutS family protein [Hyphomicrobiaceae bacterium]
MTNDKDKKSKRAKRRPETLTGEDREIWDRVAETVDPLQSRKAHVRDGNDVEALEAYLNQTSPNTKSDRGRAPSPTHQSVIHNRTRPQKIQPGHAASIPPKPNNPPPLNNFEVRKARKIRSGAISIEARIDLHGMRQAEAHAALRSFLISARARGNKWVLVITGKGLRIGDRSLRDVPFNDPDDNMDRGVLRRNVPGWLAEPDLRKVVVSYTTAAPHHGGDGAIYVQLRSKRR